MEFEAPEPRGFARCVGDGLVDAADIPSFKEDVVASEKSASGLRFSVNIVAVTSAGVGRRKQAASVSDLNQRNFGVL